MSPPSLNGAPARSRPPAGIYALGVVFHEMLTGKLPLGKFAPPSTRVEVDVRLDEVVLRALESKPAQRFQHVSEVKTDVVSLSSGEQPTGQAVPETAWWQWLMAFTVLPRVALSPFASTIMGSVGISKIRASRGRLIGLPLALGAALLFPLLLLDLLVWWAVAALSAGSEAAAVLSALLALVADAVLVWLAWRAVSQPVVEGIAV